MPIAPTPDEYYNSMELNYRNFEGLSIALKEELRNLIETLDDKADFIIDEASRITLNMQILANNVASLHENVEQLTHNSNLLIALAVIGIVTTAVLGVAILINQRKIKKQLQALLDKKDDTPLSEENG